MSITTWNRLEPDIVHDDPLRGVEDSLESRLADPLWLLARQWQMGELRGEDGGSLVASRTTIASYTMTELRIGDTTRALSADVPLEALVEAEPTAADLQLRVDGGELLAALLEQHGLRRLVAVGRDRFRWAPQDGGAEPLVRLAAVRHADGARVAASIRANRLADDLEATAPDGAALALVAEQWLAWYGARAGTTSSDAWIPDRLEHAFSVRAHAAEGWITLDALEYPGGRLDWDDFVVADVERDRGAMPARRSIEAQPLVVDVPGMPVVRFWELEDPRFDPARVSLGPGDLGAALVVEVSLTYASDWFLVPAALPIGALHRIEELVATDTFGVAHVIRSAEQVRPASDWNLWTMTRARPDLPRLAYLFTPASVADTVAGEPIEEVAFFRDELANLAWAIERIVPDGLGRGAPVDRRRSPRARPLSVADLVYIPLPALPADRVPLARTASVHGAILRRAAAVDPALEIGASSGALLTPGFAVREEELGRDGLVITRRWQLALDAEGGRRLWRTRAKEPAASLRSVRMAFDDLVEPTTDR